VENLCLTAGWCQIVLDKRGHFVHTSWAKNDQQPEGKANMTDTVHILRAMVRGAYDLSS
jgi:hypothetical protein